MKTFEPELGQMMFGNPTGRFETPSFITNGINRIDERVATDLKGAKMVKTGYGEWLDTSEFCTSNTGAQHILENAPFEMRAYYWGDCDCGFDTVSWDAGEEVAHTGDCYRTRLDELGGYRFRDKGNEVKVEALCKEMGLTYPDGCMVHCTCDHSERWQSYMLGHFGRVDDKPDCTPNLPNFKHFESGFEVRWYKHSQRGQSCNMELTVEQWRQIEDQCIDWIKTQKEAEDVPR